METEYFNKNVILIGEFKPSKFDRLFFIKTQIASEESIGDESIFMPDFTVLHTDNFSIEINSNRMSINFKDSNIQWEDVKWGDLAGNTSIFAFGLNFQKVLFVEDLQITRTHFYVKDNPLNTFFESDQATFGYYASTDFEGGRLKLDVRPVKLRRIDIDETRSAIDFSFNYHFENVNFLETVSKFDYLEKHTDTIISHYGQSF